MSTKATGGSKKRPDRRTRADLVAECRRDEEKRTTAGESEEKKRYSRHSKETGKKGLDCYRGLFIYKMSVS